MSIHETYHAQALGADRERVRCAKGTPHWSLSQQLLRLMLAPGAVTGVVIRAVHLRPGDGLSATHTRLRPVLVKHYFQHPLLLLRERAVAAVCELLRDAERRFFKRVAANQPADKARGLVRVLVNLVAPKGWLVHVVLPLRSATSRDVRTRNLAGYLAANGFPTRRECPCGSSSTSSPRCSTWPPRGSGGAPAAVLAARQQSPAVMIRDRHRPGRFPYVQGIDLAEQRSKQPVGQRGRDLARGLDGDGARPRRHGRVPGGAAAHHRRH